MTRTPTEAEVEAAARKSALASLDDIRLIVVMACQAWMEAERKLPKGSYLAGSVDDHVNRLRELVSAAYAVSLKGARNWRDDYEGAMSDLDAALDVLIRRINGEADLASAREWVRLNYPKRASQLSADPVSPAPVGGDVARRSELERFRIALASISKNTCCDTCQEASRVASRALEQQNPGTASALTKPESGEDRG